MARHESPKGRCYRLGVVRSGITAVVPASDDLKVDLSVESIARQTLQAVETVRVGGEVSPFHRALNHGAKQVRTEYLVQVDTDMRLDPNCFADLLGTIRPTVDVVVGQLRDPLLGRIQGVKLIRTQALRETPYRDHVAPDRDFVARRARVGGVLLVALAHERAPQHTFGDHLPAYTPAYAFGRLYVLGQRHLKYGIGWRLHQVVRDLAVRSHAAASPALAGALRGALVRREPAIRDLYEDNSDYPIVCELLRADNLGRVSGMAPSPGPDHRECFAEFAHHGRVLAAENAGASFREAMARHADSDERADLVALLGLCWGVFNDPRSEESLRAAHADLACLFAAG